MTASIVCRRLYAPINGLPQDGGGGGATHGNLTL